MAEHRQLLRVLRVYKLTAGGVLDEAMTPTSPVDGGTLSLEAVTDFDPDGGRAVIEPGTPNEEFIYYTTIDEAKDLLVGVTRDNPKSHAPNITFIQEGEEPTIEKWAEGKLDDDEDMTFHPVDAMQYPMLRYGVYDDETSPTVEVAYDDDLDQMVVVGVPAGAVPSFDEDLEVLPPVGGGDSSVVTTDPDTGKVRPPKGMGYEDGKVPTGTVTPVVTGGIGNVLFVRFPTLANSSIVRYQVHVHTTLGFTPGPTTLYATVDLAGTAGFDGVVAVKDFPTGHVLDGTASDPPQPGTVYEAAIVPSDGSGDAAGPYPRATGSPIQIATVHIDQFAITEALLAANAVTQTKIADDSISSPKIIAGAVLAGKIATGAITTDKLAANAVSADKIAANTITAAQIAASTITASEIAAATITGAKIAASTITASEIAAATITGAKIAASTITADKLSVSTLSAISADIGTITAGSITGVTITGSQIRTAASGGRIELGWGAALQRLEFFNTSGVGVFNINSGSDNNAFIGAPASGGKIIVQLGTLRWDNPPQWGNTADANSIPGVSSGVGQALPANPAVYLKVLTPAGGVRWIPAF